MNECRICGEKFERNYECPYCESEDFEQDIDEDERREEQYADRQYEEWKQY